MENWTMDENFKSLAILPLRRYGKLNNLEKKFRNLATFHFKTYLGRLNNGWGENVLNEPHFLGKDIKKSCKIHENPTNLTPHFFKKCVFFLLFLGFFFFNDWKGMLFYWDYEWSWWRCSINCLHSNAVLVIDQSQMLMFYNLQL